jgi:competence protein ComEC
LTLGLLIGDDSALTVDERDDLRRAGLSHITAVSGWNVTLVASAVGVVLLHIGLRGWKWTILQLAALAGFVWIVGPDPPVARAALMAVAGLVAARLGRPAHSLTVLTCSAAMLLMVSPVSLTSLSFQLSVLSTGGLIVAGHICRGLTGWTSVLVTPVAVTGSIGLITAPLLAAKFGAVSLATIPANLVAAPLIPLATLGGVLVIVASPLAPAAAAVGWLGWLVSAGVLGIARVFSSLPGAYHEFTPLTSGEEAALYLVALLIVGAIVPEGRSLLREWTDWARREPIGATVSAATVSLILLAASLIV